MAASTPSKSKNSDKGVARGRQMIIYEGIKTDFINDIENGVLVDKLYSEFMMIDEQKIVLSLPQYWTWFYKICLTIKTKRANISQSKFCIFHTDKTLLY